MKIKIVGKGKIGSLFFDSYGDDIVESSNYSKDLNNDIKCDAIIDFSHPNNLNELLNYCTSNNVPLIIGTTGYDVSQENKIIEASKKIPICKDVNFSNGINKLKDIIKKYVYYYDDILISETHRIDKKDSPSGTALMLKKYILSLNPSSNVIIRSIRKGDVNGIHKIVFKDEFEELSIVHKVSDRTIFVDGAYYAALLLKDKQNGIYSFKDLIDGRE